MMRARSQRVQTWRKMLRASKEDQSKPNPFEEPDNGVLTRMSTHDPELMNLIDGLLDELKKQLTGEDSERRKAGVVFPHEMSPTVFLRQALDVEAAQ